MERVEAFNIWEKFSPSKWDELTHGTNCRFTDHG